MKKIIVSLIMLVLLSFSVFASSITLDRTIDMSGVISEVDDHHNLVVADNRIIFSDGNDLVVYSLLTGNLLFDGEIYGAGQGYYFDDRYFFCRRELFLDGWCKYLDMTTEGYYSLSDSEVSSTGAFGDNLVPVSSSGSRFYFMIDDISTGGAEGTKGSDYYYFDYDADELTYIDVGSGFTEWATFGKINDGWFMTYEGRLINITDPSNSSEMDTSAYNADRGFTAWDGNRKAITVDNKIYNFADLNNILITGLGFNSSLEAVKFVNDRNIIATDGLTFWLVDFSDKLNPVEVDTGVVFNGDLFSLSDGYAPDWWGQYNEEDDYLVVLNLTSEKLYVYSLETEATCLSSGGCLLNDTFEYDDSVINHDWTGTDVSPVDGSLVCDGSYLADYYLFTPVSDDDGAVVLSMDFNICDDDEPYTELTLSLWDDRSQSIRAMYLRIRETGDILGNPTATNDNQVSVGTFSPNCSVNRSAEHLDLVLNMQNNPNTYSVYINGIEQSVGNRFTIDGDSVDSLNAVYLSSSVVPDYCNWSIEGIDLRYVPSASLANGTETFGAFVLPSDGSAGSFDESRCRADEQKTWCFLRVMVGDVMQWFLDLVVNNILLFTAFILLAILILTLKKKM